MLILLYLLICRDLSRAGHTGAGERDACAAADAACIGQRGQHAAGEGLDDDCDVFSTALVVLCNYLLVRVARQGDADKGNASSVTRVAECCRVPSWTRLSFLSLALRNKHTIHTHNIHLVALLSHSLPSSTLGLPATTYGDADSQ